MTKAKAKPTTLRIELAPILHAQRQRRADAAGLGLDEYVRAELRGLAAHAHAVEQSMNLEKVRKARRASAVDQGAKVKAMKAFEQPVVPGIVREPVALKASKVARVSKPAPINIAPAATVDEEKVKPAPKVTIRERRPRQV